MSNFYRKYRDLFIEDLSPKPKMNSLQQYCNDPIRNQTQFPKPSHYDRPPKFNIEDKGVATIQLEKEVLPQLKYLDRSLNDVNIGTKKYAPIFKTLENQNKSFAERVQNENKILMRNLSFEKRKSPQSIQNSPLSPCYKHLDKSSPNPQLSNRSLTKNKKYCINEPHTPNQFSGRDSKNPNYYNTFDSMQMRFPRLNHNVRNKSRNLLQPSGKIRTQQSRNISTDRWQSKVLPSRYKHRLQRKRTKRPNNYIENVLYETYQNQYQFVYHRLQELKQPKQYRSHKLISRWKEAIQRRRQAKEQLPKRKKRIHLLFMQEINQFNNWDIQ